MLLQAARRLVITERELEKSEERTDTAESWAVLFYAYIV